MQKWQCRTAPSIGALEDTPDNIWHTKPYLDEFQPTVFFGLYGLNDFYTLWRHKGRKCILWAGSDIQHFLLGYWLDEEGKMRIHPTQLSNWIDTYCENYVENEVEQNALRSVGIRSKVVPSFLGKIGEYEIAYEFSVTPKLYTSVSGNNYELYGWDKIAALAQAHPEVEFHLYGSNTPFPTPLTNMIDHGRVPKEQMNEEVKNMQGCLRLTSFDGFSEIVAKALLWGQWPVSIIEYPHTLRPDSIVFPKEPNLKGRDWLLANVNRYPWVC
jgi:hypothetical protein